MLGGRRGAATHPLPNRTGEIPTGRGRSQPADRTGEIPTSKFRYMGQFYGKFKSNEKKHQLIRPTDPSAPLQTHMVSRIFRLGTHPFFLRFHTIVLQLRESLNVRSSIFFRGFPEAKSSQAWLGRAWCSGDVACLAFVSRREDFL